MKLVLEIQSGELTGHKRWLIPGERMLVGRTEQAELAVPDPKMSGVHFFVECHSTECRVHDTRSTNGTFLNGRQIAEDVLHDGDVIVAGDTEFRVQIGDDASAEPSPEQPEESLAADVDHAAISIKQTVASTPSAAFGAIAGEAPRSLMDRGEETPSATGVHPLKGSSQDVADLVQHLSEISPLHLIVDFSKIAMTVPEDLELTNFLYDWIPEKLRASFSPAVIDGSTARDWAELLASGWGHNCTLCLFSSLPTEELVEQLRQLTQTGEEQEPRREYACPDALAGLFSNGPEAFMKGLFDAVDAVLFEDDNVEECCLLASADFHRKLRELGLKGLSE